MATRRSTEALAFLQRKVRKQRTWSTKSNKPIDRRKLEFRPRRPAATSTSQSLVAQSLPPGTLGPPLPAGPAAYWNVGGEFQYLSFERRDGDDEDAEWGPAARSSSAWRPRGPMNGFDAVDPFSCAAVTLDSRDKSLMAYCESQPTRGRTQRYRNRLTRRGAVARAVSPRIAPLTRGHQSQKMNDSWIAPAVGNAAFMHALLCLTSLHLFIAQPHDTGHVERCIHHKALAMAAIQRNMLDSRLATCDENIAAVFNIVCVDEVLLLHISVSPKAIAGPLAELQPSLRHRAMHMSGLRHMISVRGGIEGLGQMRALQSFLLRWSVMPRCGRLLCPPLPHPAAGPATPRYGREAEDDEDWTTEQPETLLRRMYGYPRSSRFYPLGSTMAAACLQHGMNPQLVEHIMTATCIIRDVELWLSNSQSTPWDMLDIYNISTLIFSGLAYWILDNELSFSAVEGVTALSLFCLITFFLRSNAGVCGPVPGFLTRFRRYFLDPDVKTHLRALGIDIWVAMTLLMVSKGNEDQVDFFIQLCRNLIATRDPPIRSFEDFKKYVSDYVWDARAMDNYARIVWLEATEGMGPEYSGSAEESDSRLRVTPPSRPIFGNFNPYSTRHVKMFMSVNAREDTAGSKARP